MDKANFLRRRNEQKLLQPTFKREEFCFQCFRVQKNCLCHFIKPFDSNIHFVLLMHPMEAKKEKTGTGRLSLACLKNSSLIIGIDFSDDLQVNDLLLDENNHCVVLYPGERAINISSDDVSSLIDLPPKRLVVFLIDGTWPCAKKMMRLSKNINTLPRVSFSATHESQFIIKEQPAKYCLSTIESIHFFLSECDRRGLESLKKGHDHMLEVFKAMIDFQIKCALDPSLPSYRQSPGGYSHKKERMKSKKWGTNRIIFKD